MGVRCVLSHALRMMGRKFPLSLSAKIGLTQSDSQSVISQIDIRLKEMEASRLFPHPRKLAQTTRHFHTGGNQCKYPSGFPPDAGSRWYCWQASNCSKVQFNHALGMLEV